MITVTVLDHQNSDFPEPIIVLNTFDDDCLWRWLCVSWPTSDWLFQYQWTWMNECFLADCWPAVLATPRSMVCHTVIIPTLCFLLPCRWSSWSVWLPPFVLTSRILKPNKKRINVDPLKNFTINMTWLLSCHLDHLLSSIRWQISVKWPDLKHFQCSPISRKNPMISVKMKWLMEFCFWPPTIDTCLAPGGFWLRIALTLLFYPQCMHLAWLIARAHTPS